MLDELTENKNVELKRAKNDLPKSFWDTYSSFLNTDGGVVVLGVSEGKFGTEITGVENINKILSDLYTLSNDETYTNYNGIKEEYVEVIDLHGKKIITIYIPEAEKSSKPVYIKGSINNSFIRRNESDQKMKEHEIRRYLRDANPVGDSQLLDNFGIEDLDLTTIRRFKDFIQEKENDVDIYSIDDWEFLKLCGAVGKDENDGIFKLKRGALLFFGKEVSITSIYPYFHVDYRNRIEETLEKRWIDRVSSGEINSKEINLFNFYNIVLDKMMNTVLEGFSLDSNTQRRDNVKRGVEVAIREALANSLIHADYEDDLSIKIEAFNNRYIFTNPGEMLVTKEEFAKGGESKLRNATIVTLFRRAGFSERAGTGGMKIFQVALKNKFRYPEINSEEGRTKVVIWKADLIDSYPDLDEREKKILIFIEKNGRSKMTDINGLEGMTEYYSKKFVSSLIEKEILVKFGTGRSTTYGFKTGSSQMIASLENDIRRIQDLLVNIQKS